MVPFILKFVGISPEEGALTPLFLLTSKEAAEPGNRAQFWDRYRWKWTPAWMDDAGIRRTLWKQWEEDAGVDASF